MVIGIIGYFVGLVQIIYQKTNIDSYLLFIIFLWELRLIKLRILDLSSNYPNFIIISFHATAVYNLLVVSPLKIKYLMQKQQNNFFVNASFNCFSNSGKQ